MVKRFLFSLALVLATCSLYADVLTVNDGTATNSCVPAYGLNFDTPGTHSQSFFSSEQLDEISGGTISGLTFYSSTATTPSNWNGAQLTVKVVETSSTNLSAAFADLTSATTVATLAPTLVDGEFVITFDAPFSYQGGNLVVDIAVSAKGGYKSVPWYGVTTTGYGRYATSATAAGYSANFAPKTQFTFTPGVAPTCAKPSDKPVVSNIGSYGADLVWGAASGVSQYQYSVVAAGSDADWTTAVLTSDTAATLSGLNPNTNYTVFVRSYCGADDQSRVVSANFKTECAAVTPEALGVIGFETSEGFETGAGKMENCWTVGSRKSTSTSYIPYAYSGATYAFEGANSLKFSAYTYGTSTNYDSAYAVLPALNYGEGSITDYEVVLYLRKSGTTSGSYNYNDTLFVGTMSDASDFSTYSPVGYAVSTSTTYAKVVVSLENALSNNIVLLAAVDWSVSASTKYASFYVDNIQVRKRSTCLTPVLDDDQTAMTSTTAYLAWTCPTMPDHYRVMLSKNETLRPDTVTAWELDTTVYDANISLEGLTPATNYYVYVQAVCGDDDASDFSTITKITTECALISTLPYIETFDGMDKGSGSGPAPQCWGLLNANNGYPQIYVNTSSTYLREGSTKSLYLYSSATVYGYAITPEFEMDLNTTQLSCWYKLGSSTTTTSYNYITLGYFNGEEVEANFVPLLEFEHQPGTWLEVSGYSLDALPAGVRKVAFRYGGSGKNYASAAIEDLKIEALPSCIKPKNVVADSVSKNAVVLAWQGSASNYQVLVKNGTDTLYNGVVADTALAISGLEHSTVYTLSVEMAAICSATDTSDVLNANVSFTTECEVVTSYPWTCNFENQTPNNLIKDIPCFEGFSKKGAGVDWKITASGHSSSSTRCAQATYSASSLGRTESNISLPTFYLEPGKNYLLSYWVKGNNSGSTDSLLVYVNDEILHKVNSKTEVGGAWLQITDTLAGAGNTVITFGYQNLNGYYAYLDDITLSEIIPTCGAVSNIHVADSTETTVTIAWNDTLNQAGVSYKVLVIDARPALLDAELVADTLVNDTLTATEVVLNGLTPATEYNFFVSVVAVADGMLNSVAATAELTVSTLTPIVPVCDTVSNIHVADSTETSITIAWDAVADASYIVLVKLGEEALVNDTLTEAQVIVSGLTDGTPYVFDVTVVTIAADHLNSAPVSAQVAASTKAQEIVTALDDVATETKAVKIIRNNQVFILREGVLYDTTGRKVK